MRVAVDGTPLIGPTTGVGLFTRLLVRHLARESGVDLVAYTLTGRRPDLLGAELPSGVRSARPLPAPASVLLRIWSKVDHPAAELWTGAVDVVHGSNFVVPPTRRAGRVVTVHDLTAVRFPAMCAPTSLRYPALVQRAAAQGALVHTVSHAVALEVSGLLGVPAAQVRVVPNGFDPALVSGGDARRGRRLAGADRYVLAVGTLEPRKGYPDLVRAFDRIGGDHRDTVLVIAGPRGWGSEEVDHAVEDARHGERVRLLGWIPDSTRADLLAGADVVVVPSVYEGFGYPVLEAMANARPVVVTNAGALPEVAGDRARVVAAGDLDALAGALDDILANRGGIADRLAAGGPDRAAQFSPATAAHAMVGVYDDAVEQR